MSDLNGLTSFFGWCSLINLALLTLTTLLLLLFKGPIAELHGRLFGLDSRTLPSAYFIFLGNYKLAILVFNLTPYLALKLMG